MTLHTGGLNHLSMARWIARSVILFVTVSVVSFPVVGGVGRFALVLGLAAVTATCGALLGRSFLRVTLPIPEGFLAMSWLLAAIGLGNVWGSLTVDAAILFLSLAPILAVAAALWSAIRWVTVPSLQGIVSFVAAMVSLVTFLLVIAKL